MKPYTVLVVFRKDNNEIIVVERLSTYIAGILGSCNRVAGLVFRIEAALFALVLATCNI